MARNDLPVTHDTFRRFKYFYSEVQVSPVNSLGHQGGRTVF